MVVRAARVAAWDNKFQTPSADDLISGLGDEERVLLEDARSHLLSFEGIREQVAWQGVAWQWALTYRHESEPDRGWAFLIANPARPELALPMPSAAVETLKLNRLKKFVRDGLMHAKFVGGVYWPSWELLSSAQLDELKTLIERKHSFSEGRGPGG